MESQLVQGFVYKDVGRDITENDIDVVSDLWTIDGRDVYRGSRDPRYTHANVYWLYSEQLERVGLSEHNLKDQADFRILWFHDTEFGTYLQEDGWEQGDDIWSVLPRQVFDRFVNEGWTTPMPFLEHCLQGPVRIFTLDMVRSLPIVYSCSECKGKSLRPLTHCKTVVSAPLDFPTREKVFFVDEDMIVFRPPISSRVWDLITPQLPSHAGGSQAQVREQAKKPEESSPPPAPDTSTPPHTPEQAQEPLRVLNL